MARTHRFVYMMCLIGTVVLCSRPASAGVVYTTLGPGNQYDPNTGYNLPGTSPFDQVIALPFTLGTGTAVEDAVLALGNFSGNNNPVSVYIESDSFGLPGSIIASLSQVGTLAPWVPPNGGGLVTFTCSGPACTLGAGSYWLVAQETDLTSLQVWDYAYLDATGTFSQNQLGSATGPWEGPYTGNLAAFRIDGSASSVPEPSSILLLATFVLGIGITRRSIGRR